MLLDVQTFDTPHYTLGEQKNEMLIGYDEHGSTNFNMRFGYKTLFAYFHELSRSKVTEETVKRFAKLYINCGQFSFAAYPNRFKCILGVTGTLLSMGSYEREIIAREYEIKRFTITPSMYGDRSTRLNFKEADHTLVLPDANTHQQKVLDEILEKRSLGKAVLVFFKNDTAMDAFLESPYGQRIKDVQDVQEIREHTPKKDFCIRRATRSGWVSLLPRVLGRGLDFICFDPKVKAAEGIHVIQTFLSEELSEEIQIQGRTARQLNKGSYALILNQAELADEKRFNVSPAAIEAEKTKQGGNVYRLLHQHRQQFFASKTGARQELIKRCTSAHESSLIFQKELFSEKPDPTKILNFLQSQNTAVIATGSRKARIIFVFDATHSMGKLWKQAKVYIREMIKRITSIAGSPSQMELMWIAYRDYCCGADITAKSKWSSNPDEMQEFIDEIVCKGGNNDKEEAVEQGLRLANEEKDVSRIILIGDEPAHKQEVGEFLTGHKTVQLQTNYRVQVAELKRKEVPVFAFWMDKLAQSNFEEIAALTGGQAARLENAKCLIDVVAEQTLTSIGGQTLVEQYRRTYMK